jgi:hypothetical protein
MKRPVKLPIMLERVIFFPGTRPANAAVLNHPTDAWHDGDPSVTASSFHPRCLCDNEVTQPFIRACLDTNTCGAGEDPKEERRPLYRGSHVRPWPLNALAPPA